MIGHRYLLMKFHVIQFQYGFELIRLTCSQFVHTFQDVIKWHPGHRQWNFIPSRIEFLNIIAKSNCDQRDKKISVEVVKNGIMSACSEQTQVTRNCGNGNRSFRPNQWKIMSYSSVFLSSYSVKQCFSGGPRRSSFWAFCSSRLTFF